MSVSSLPLSDFVNVAVNISPVAATTPSFNQGLIIGTSTTISTTTRLAQFSSLSAIATAGFSTSSAEYLAAQAYFAQTPTPQYVWIGRQDLTVPETALQAITACRLASSVWYGAVVLAAATADHEAIAPYIEAVTPPSVYFALTSDAAVLANTAGNCALTLQAASYKRTFLVYSTTQSAAAPLNAYTAAASLGEAMGLNTGLANSNFTMKFKTLVSITAEPLTQTQVTNMETANCNLYVNYAGAFNFLEQGVTPSGQYLDVTMGLDMLVADVQYSVGNLLVGNPSVPHTNAGQGQLLATVSGACDRAVSRGFLASGTWNGQTVLNLTPGTPLPKGYMVQSQSLTLQSAGDRQARKAMPVYVTICLAGSMHSLTIGVYVQS